MKGPSAARMSQFLNDENLVWVEQHHRATATGSNTKSSFNYSGLSSTGNDYTHSGDENESDSLDRIRSQFYVGDPLKRTKEYHLDQAIQAIRLLKAAAKPNGWKKVAKHKSGCLVYQSTGSNDKHPAFKGEHVIRGYRAQDVFSVVGVRKLWDDWYDELSCVESYDESTNLMYMVMKSTLSSKTRDISMVERIEVERDGTIYFASCSVESNKIPRISGKVRADIFVAGWIIQPLPSNPPITKITYVIQTDLLSRLPKFIARRSLAKRPLVITTIETHLKKNGAPLVIEPLKPDKFHFTDDNDSPDNVAQSGSAFLSPIQPLTKHNSSVEQLDDPDETDDYELQQTISAINGRSDSRNSRNSLAPSLMSQRSIAPSIFTSEFIENNAVLGDTALFGDSVLFGKGGIFESTIRNQDGTLSTVSHSNQQQQLSSKSLLNSHQDRSNRPSTSAVRPLSPESETPSRHSSVGLDHRRSNQLTTPKSDYPRSRTSRYLNQNSTSPDQTLTPVVTPATPPLTPTTSTDGKDAASDSDASMTARVKVVPRTPKSHARLDTTLAARPSSMAFAAYGMRSPSSIMEARRHSTLIGRSSSFHPRHSTIIPMRSNPNLSLSHANLNRSSVLGLGGYGGYGAFGGNPNAMKRQSTVPSLNSDRSSSNGGSGYGPVIVMPHRHSETARKALAMFKVLSSSPEDRWRAVSNENGFKSYSRVISGAGLPMLRGEGVITGGWTVEQINAVIESAGCRQVWDERFENMSVAETFNQNEYLFHVTLRGVSSLTGRDLAGVTIVDRDAQTSALYNVSTSVLDPTIPEDPGRIRALLELSGWSLRPTFDGQGNTVAVNVTYVIQVDIRGTLANSVVKAMTASMTTAVPRLNHFLNKTGYPPYASHISGTRLLDTFDPKTGFYELCYKAAPGWTEIRVGRKVYKDGYDFFIKPDDPTVRVELAPDFGGVRVWTTLDHEGQSIVAQVTRKGQNPAMSRSGPKNESGSESDESRGDGRHSSLPSPRDRSGDGRSGHAPPVSPSYSSSSSLSSHSFGQRRRSTMGHQGQSNDEKNIVNEMGSESAIRPEMGAGESLVSQSMSSSSIIGRKRRSAEGKPRSWSAFDANTDDDVASTFDRLHPQTSTLASTTPAEASASFERKGRSRTRTPRSLVSIPSGAPSPPLPRRSSSLSRYSIPLSAYLAQEDAPPVPTTINATAATTTITATSPRSNNSTTDQMTVTATSASTTPISSPLEPPLLSPTLSSPSVPEPNEEKVPAVSAPYSSPTTSQPGSPTLGPFHVSHIVPEPHLAATKAEEDLVPESSLPEAANTLTQTPSADKDDLDGHDNQKQDEAHDGQEEVKENIGEEVQEKNETLSSEAPEAPKAPKTLEVSESQTVASLTNQPFPDPPTTSIPPVHPTVSTKAAVASSVVTAISLSALDDAEDVVARPPPTPPKRTSSLPLKEVSKSTVLSEVSSTDSNEKTLVVAAVEHQEAIVAVTTETSTAAPTAEDGVTKTVPIPVSTLSLPATSPMASSLKHSSSASSTTSSTRRVTFSPDVRDICAEDRPSRLKPRARRSSKGGKKNKTATTTTTTTTATETELASASVSGTISGTDMSPLESLANIKPEDVKHPLEVMNITKGGLPVLVQQGGQFGSLSEQSQDYESDEAEFVEAEQDFEVSQEEKEKEAMSTTTTTTTTTTVFKKDASKSTIELEFDMEDYGRAWVAASADFGKELRWTQLRIVILVVIGMCVANGSLMTVLERYIF
ncbi:hypothetical protein BGZ94_003329 [Podila epigama]|nr:hypothetical protein BGZ94_003329 [Podila epigama]